MEETSDCQLLIGGKNIMASPLFSSQFIDFSHDLSCVEGGSRESSGTLTENSVCTPLVMNSEQFSDDLDDLDIFSVLLGGLACLFLAH